MESTTLKKSSTPRRRWWTPLLAPWINLDRQLDGAVSFFFRHYGKSRFMLAMSKKLQVLGLEKLYRKGPKAFLYFFLFYLLRDTILYIILPIYFAGFFE